MNRVKRSAQAAGLKELDVSTEAISFITLVFLGRRSKLR